ncbi:hypothetical protein GGQ22_05020 [Nocardioides sp. zg-579]|uniref:Uncharacterized protein n=1 Tax=Nocardioides marmotae TaxID=2663857 RepID=A0A6I3J223_9ACTN|nr:hypothetical protein [Nocardioides marmotae]MCR6030801.1 hypothetical protein [Gordonia jinghuaiqii]MTB94436.1 hypothetical protein [Nocardioides marmotae]QKE01542.1 hypothetical protein HPC71_10975 [Nocardioides marmotae]
MTHPDPSDELLVKLNGEAVPISRTGFDLLFDNSHRRAYADIRHAREDGYIHWAALVHHARAADIPWTLFFAPVQNIRAQVKRKTALLLKGTSKQAFSMNSRHEVQLADVELIVKDLLRKQERLKRLDSGLGRNKVVGCLGKPAMTKRSVVEDASILRAALGFTLAELHAYGKKERAFAYLIERFEAQQVFVSRNQPGYMLQRVPQGIKFSGLTVKDNKIPYLFLASGDEGDFEPEGRKIFTMVLLAALIGYGTFSPVTFEDKTGDGDIKREYEVAGEVLMPRAELKRLSVPDLAAARAYADAYKVTPSAFVMRAWKLGLIDRETADAWLEELARAWREREKKSLAGQATPINAIRRYCGHEYFSRMIIQLGLGRIDVGEFRRSVCLNHLSVSEVRDLAGA